MQAIMVQAGALLRDAREIIAKPENWTKRAYARSALGGVREVDDADATCWCLLGAIDLAECRRARGAVEAHGCSMEGEESRHALVIGIEWSDACDAAITRLAAETGGPALPSFNDAATHGEVLAALDRAIKAVAA